MEVSWPLCCDSQHCWEQSDLGMLSLIRPMCLTFQNFRVFTVFFQVRSHIDVNFAERRLTVTLTSYVTERSTVTERNNTAVKSATLHSGRKVTYRDTLGHMLGTGHLNVNFVNRHLHGGDTC